MPVMSNPDTTYSGIRGRNSRSNLALAAQNGIGVNLPALDGAMPQAWHPPIIVVTHVPEMWKLIPRGDELIRTLFERHVHSFDGIDPSLNGDPLTQVIGHDKQPVSLMGSMSRPVINPTANAYEVRGNVVFNTIETWLWLMRQPDTQTPGASVIGYDSGIDIGLASTFSMDIAVIQYDDTLRPEHILDGFFITNMMPTETGTEGIKREMGSVEIQERSIPMTGIMQRNQRAFETVQEIAGILGLHRINYERSVPIVTEVQKALAGDGGILGQIENAASTFR